MTVDSNATSRGIETWNKKIHIYLGLYFLLFLWLFAVSGLFLNHPRWFHGMPQRDRTERTVQVPAEGDDLERAKAVAKQLGITGEILTARVPPKPGLFNFRIFRPNRLANVSVDLQTNTATIQTVRGRLTGVLENMHTFSGVRDIWGEAQSKRDWIYTWIWSISMDLLCVGLVILVLSSYYMWYLLRDKWAWGLVAFVLGVVACGFFLVGMGRL
jgi:hypothetical protein